MKNIRWNWRDSAFRAILLGLILAGGLALPGKAANAAITVPGPGGVDASMLSEWGVTINTGHNQNSYTFDVHTLSASEKVSGKVGVSNGNQWHYSKDGLTFDAWVEDTNGESTVGPGAGGQNYDAEYLGLTLHSGSIVSIAIATGQRPDNVDGSHSSDQLFSPGDIRFKTASGRTFGIEVGGGKPSDGGPSPIFEGAAGTTYLINANGYTVDSFTSSDVRRTAGSIWETKVPADWEQGLGFAGGPYYVQMKLELPYDSYRGEAKFAYSLSQIPGQHAAIELSFDASSFLMGESIVEVSWAPSCANDYAVILEVQNRQITPEPASLLLWGGIGLGTAFVTWRKRKAMKLQNR